MNLIEKARTQAENVIATTRDRARQMKHRRDHHNRLADLGSAYFRGRESEEDTDAELDRLMDEVRELADQLGLDPDQTVDLTDQGEGAPSDADDPVDASSVGSR